MDNVTNVIGSVSRFKTGGLRKLREKGNSILDALGENFTFEEFLNEYKKNRPPVGTGDYEKYSLGVSVLEDYKASIGADAAEKMVHGYSVEELSGHNCVFVLPDRRNPTELIKCVYPYLYLIEKRDTDFSASRHPVVFFYEEGDDIFCIMEDKSEHPVNSILAKKGRFVSVSTCVTTQTLDLDPLFMSNVYCFVFKPLSNPKHVQAMQQNTRRENSTSSFQKTLNASRLPTSLRSASSRSISSSRAIAKHLLKNALIPGTVALTFLSAKIRSQSRHISRLSSMKMFRQLKKKSEAPISVLLGLSCLSSI